MMVYAENLSDDESSEMENICVNVMDSELEPPLSVKLTLSSLNTDNQYHAASVTTASEIFKNVIVPHDMGCTMMQEEGCNKDTMSKSTYTYNCIPPHSAKERPTYYGGLTTISIGLIKKRL